MLGLNPPRTQNSVDEIFDVCEEVFKQRLQQARVQAKKDFKEFERIQNKPAKDFLRQQALQHLQTLDLNVYGPIAQFLQKVQGPAFEIEFAQKPTPEVRYPKQSGEDIPRVSRNKQQQNLQQNANKRSVNQTKINDQFNENLEVNINRYQEFVQFPIRKADQVKLLQVNCNSQSIGDYGMDHFSDVLSKFQNVEQVVINLDNNNITQIGGQKLGYAFYNLKKLRSLNLSLYNNKIKAKGAECLMQNISALPHIVELNLELACNSIGNKGIEDVGRYILGMRNILKLWLGVYDNQIYEEGMKEFLHLFSQWPVHRTLKLDFRVNPISKKNYEQLKTYIKHKKIIDFQILQ